MRILEMVRSGKITPEEGEKLLTAIGQGEQKQAAAKRTMLRIRVDASDPESDGRAKVNVNVPLAIAKKAMGLLSLVPKETRKELSDKGIDLDAIDLRELIEMFESGGLTEELVNVETGTDEKGAKVKIYVD